MSEQDIAETFKEHDLDPHELIAIRLIDIVAEVRDLEKKRKKSNNKVIPAISEHLAEMARGSTDLLYLQTIVEFTQTALSKKENSR